MLNGAAGRLRFGLRTCIVALGITSALALAACGSGDDSSGSTSSSSSTQAAGGKQPTGSPIKLGIISPVNTTATNNPAMVAAARAAVRGMNTRGGLEGHPVTLVFCNDKGDPSQGAKCGRQMVSEGVIAVLGGSSIVGPSFTPILEKAGIPQLGLSANSGTDYTSKNIYWLTSGSLVQWETLAAIGAHSEKVSLIVVDVAQAAPIIAQIQAAAKAAGNPLANVVKVPPAAADLSPTVAAAHANGAKGVIVLTNAEQGDLIASTAERTQPFDHYYTVHVKNKEAAGALGGEKALDKHIVASAFPAIGSDNPLVVQYRDELAAEAKSGDDDAQLQKQQRSFETWLAFVVLERVMKRDNLTDPTAASVKASIDKTKDLDLDGVIPPWSANPVKPVPGAPRATNALNYVYGYKDGVPTLMTSKPITLQQAIAGQGFEPLS